MVPPNRGVHNPVISKPSDKLADEHRNLLRVNFVLSLSNGRFLTIGVPYDPETASSLNPYPAGGGAVRNTALVTYTR